MQYFSSKNCYRIQQSSYLIYFLPILKESQYIQKEVKQFLQLRHTILLIYMSTNGT